MTSTRHATCCLLLSLLYVILLGPVPLTTAAPARPKMQGGHKSPDALFAAYRQATEARDWQQVYSLMSARRQRLELLDMVDVEVSNALEDEEAKAFLKAQGLPWKPLKALFDAADRLPQDPNDPAWEDDKTEKEYVRITRTLMDLVDRHIPDKAAGYAAFRHRFSTQNEDLGDVVTTEVEKQYRVIKQNGSQLEIVFEQTDVWEKELRQPPTLQEQQAVSNEERYFFDEDRKAWFLETKLTNAEGAILRKTGDRWYLGLHDLDIVDLEEMEGERPIQVNDE